MIQAIETRYAGCRFRSRLEARWAVFFDTLGVKWEYEPEGYETPAGRYLPDFKLTLAKRTVLFEIKPELDRPPTDYADRRGGYRDLPIDERWQHMSTIGGGFYVAYGLPWFRRASSAYADVIQDSGFCVDGFPASNTQNGFFRIWPNGERDGFLFFCQCPHCKEIDIQYAGLLLEEIPGTRWVVDEDGWRKLGEDEDSDLLGSCDHQFICCGKEYNACGDDYGLTMYHGGTPSILHAYDAARSARFEHGERG